MPKTTGDIEQTSSVRDDQKALIWQALADGVARPSEEDALTRPVNPLEVHYLIQRFATLTIYDAFNLEPASQKVPLELEGASPHFHVFDRGSSLIMVPKDLFSHERTMRDGLQTAEAIAREAYKRGWMVELVGLKEYISAAWVALQHLGDAHGRAAEIINHQPTNQELRIYQQEAVSRVINKSTPA